MDNLVTVHSLYAEASLPDTTPVNPSLIYDGTTLTEIPVPAGTKFVITDLIIGVGFVYWEIEVDFGSGFVTLARFGFTLIAPAISEKKRLKSPIVVQGGPGVKVRLKATLAADPVAPVEVSMTVRCYTSQNVAGPLAVPVYGTRTPTVITLADLATTGAVEEVLSMSENAGAPAVSLAVPSDTLLQITDFDVASGGGQGMFRLQQTIDGITWFTIGAVEVSGISMGVSFIVSPELAWNITGGPSVAFRLTEETPAGPIPVAAVLSGYRLSP